LPGKKQNKRTGENKVYTFRRWYIPERMGPGILRYVNDHIRPGSFLCAVISNDLRGAVMLADSENIDNLSAFSMYFYWETPPDCHGSKEKMEAWIKHKS